MYKVKTFGTEIKPFKTMREITEIDEHVNKFISENNVKRLISVSDTSTTNDNGMIVGLIRVISYEV